MSNPIITVRGEKRGDTGEYLGDSIYMWCPGCDDVHSINVSGDRTVWSWDGNREAPTFSPSILVRYGNVERVPRQCHSFVRSGRWEFLTDSTHPLAGQTVPMVPVPDWLVREAKENPCR